MYSPMWDNVMLWMLTYQPVEQSLICLSGMCTDIDAAQFEGNKISNSLALLSAIAPRTICFLSSVSRYSQSLQQARHMASYLPILDLHRNPALVLTDRDLYDVEQNSSGVFRWQSLFVAYLQACEAYYTASLEPDEDHSVPCNRVISTALSSLEVEFGSHLVHVFGDIFQGHWWCLQQFFTTSLFYRDGVNCCRFLK